jgi:hypothetical protein
VTGGIGVHLVGESEMPIDRVGDAVGRQLSDAVVVQFDVFVLRVVLDEPQQRVDYLLATDDVESHVDRFLLRDTPL